MQKGIYILLPLQLHVDCIRSHFMYSLCIYAVCEFSWWPLPTKSEVQVAIAIFSLPDILQKHDTTIVL